MHYIAPLTRVLGIFEGVISSDLYDEEIALQGDVFNSNTVFIKDGYPIGFRDVCTLSHAQIVSRVRCAGLLAQQ